MSAFLPEKHVVSTVCILVVIVLKSYLLWLAIHHLSLLTPCTLCCRVWGTFSDSQRWLCAAAALFQKCVCHLTYLSSTAGRLQPVHGIIGWRDSLYTCADHFHQHSKSVCVDGDRYSGGYLSIMNKYYQIIGQWVVVSLLMS